jgi:hypothetical protein
MANLISKICVVKLSSYCLQKKQRIVITFALIVFSICLSGCMTFNGAELPLRQFPKYDSFRPLISTEIGEIKLLYNGAEGLKPPMSAHGIGKRALKAVLRRWKTKKLIDDYDPPGKLNREPDYKLKISGTRNEQGDFFSAYKTGFTFFLFPSSYTLNWEWTFQLKNLKTNEQFEISTKNSVTGRVHLIFLPLFPFSIVGQRNADNMLSCYVYDEFKKQGAWHFSTEQVDDFR